jgi:hypothetical protein
VLAQVWRYENASHAFMNELPEMVRRKAELGHTGGEVGCGGLCVLFGGRFD